MKKIRNGLLSTSSHARIKLVDEGGDLIVPEIGFTVYLKRMPMYYLANIITPCFMVAIISCLVFLLPSDSGEKISLAITVTLAYTVLLLMVSDITPKSGTNTPFITIFIMVSMGQTTLCLLSTVLILNIYHHDPNKPVPRCLHIVMIGGLAKILCMHARVEPKESVDMITYVEPSSSIQSSGLETDQTKTVKQDLSNLPEDVIDYIRYLKAKNIEGEKEDGNRSEWRSLGKVVDRLFLVIFLSATVIELTLFMVAVHSKL